MNKTVLGIAAMWIYGGVGLVLVVGAFFVGFILIYGPVANRNMPGIEQQQEQQYQKVLSSVCAQQHAQDPSAQPDEDCSTTK